MNNLGRAGAAVIAVIGLVALVPAVALSDEGGSVVVTRPGVVFHKAGSSDVRGKGFDRTADEAIQAGYTPCPTCFGKQVGGFGSVPSGLGSGRAAAASFSLNLPTPPIGQVIQPFGVRTYGRGRDSGARGVRDPYQQPDTIISTGPEQGAFETRH